MVGPIVAGPMAVHVGWRNFWWLNVGLLGLLLVLLIFVFPETRWHRIHPKEVPAAPTTTSIPTEKGDNQVLEDREQTNHQPLAVAATQDIGFDLDHIAPAEQDPDLRRGYSSKQQFEFWQNNSNAPKALFQEFYIPRKLFTFPIVDFAAFVVSWSASSFLTLNLTQSQNFAATPYDFRAQSIGFMNFAILIGVMLGYQPMDL
ncbi:hypothetical protein LTR93_011373 [Exophiala xenobiotica]|nr:hypothetical protein LTR93_011373 [Exophiala xenobiotica]